MSFGIVCLKCRRYINVGEQVVHASVQACECAEPAYSEDAQRAITKVQAEEWARRFNQARTKGYL